MRAQERVANSAEKISQGQVDAENLIDLKVASTDAQAQMKTIKIISETEDRLIDEIA